MPTYIYKAVTRDGRIVRNRVEDGNKLSLIRKLKANGLAPISITQTIARKLQPAKKQKRNILFLHSFQLFLLISYLYLSLIY